MTIIYVNYYIKVGYTISSNSYLYIITAIISYNNFKSDHSNSSKPSVLLHILSYGRHGPRWSFSRSLAPQRAGAKQGSLGEWSKTRRTFSRLGANSFPFPLFLFLFFLLLLLLLLLVVVVVVVVVVVFGISQVFHDELQIARCNSFRFSWKRRSRRTRSCWSSLAMCGNRPLDERYRETKRNAMNATSLKIGGSSVCVIFSNKNRAIQPQNFYKTATKKKTWCLKDPTPSGQCVQSRNIHDV